MEPQTGRTLRIATGLPIMLTRMAVLPTTVGTTASTGAAALVAAHRRSNSGESEEKVVAGGIRRANAGETNDVVVAVGGVGGRVQLVGIQVMMP